MGQKGKLVIKDFSGGLNVKDSTVDIPSNQLVVADNVKYELSGEVLSIDDFEQIGKDIQVNSIDATKILGGYVFNETKYIMASNNTIARLLYFSSPNWVEATSQNFNKDNNVQFEVLAGKLWFVNSLATAYDAKTITAFADAGSGQVTVTSAGHNLLESNSITISGTTNYNGTFVITNVTTNTFEITDTWVANDATGSIAFSAVLNFIDTSGNLTGLDITSGLEVGMAYIRLHNSRIWIAKQNAMFVSIMYPQAADADWDASTTYTGADTAGVIPIDNNTEDEIVGLLVNYDQLVIMRKFSLWLLTGAVILQSQMTKRTNTRTGVKAPSSISKADKIIYFYGKDGVKTFTGQTVQEGTTNFDTISTVTIDEPIKPLIAQLSSLENMVGYAFKDKYYMSDGSTVVFVWDERLSGWSRWTISGIELFLEQDELLYGFKGTKYYQLDSDATGSVTSKIKTKDFDCDFPGFWKMFQKLIMTFRRVSSTHTFTLYWHLDGSTDNSGSVTITVQGSTVTWDVGYKWDQPGIRWDQGTINFLKKTERKMKSASTIAFTIEATGTNRFSLSTLHLIFNKLKREVR